MYYVLPYVLYIIGAVSRHEVCLLPAAGCPAAVGRRRSRMASIAATVAAGRP